MLAPITVASCRRDQPSDFNAGNVSPACSYPYHAVHPFLWLLYVSSTPAWVTLN